LLDLSYYLTFWKENGAIILSKLNNSEHFLNLFFSKFQSEPDSSSFIFGFHGDVNAESGLASLHRVGNYNVASGLKLVTLPTAILKMQAE
jgi:hypothetical protein